MRNHIAKISPSALPFPCLFICIKTIGACLASNPPLTTGASYRDIGCNTTMQTNMMHRPQNREYHMHSGQEYLVSAAERARGFHSSRLTRTNLSWLSSSSSASQSAIHPTIQSRPHIIQRHCESPAQENRQRVLRGVTGRGVCCHEVCWDGKDML